MKADTCARNVYPEDSCMTQMTVCSFIQRPVALTFKIYKEELHVLYSIVTLNHFYAVFKGK